MTSTDPGPQDDLLPGLARSAVRRARAGAAAKAARSRAPVPLAEVDPVASVLVDHGLAHLDRAFDYAVPATMAEAAQPGVRVKVRFAGHDVDGFVLARASASDHAGQLTPLKRVVGTEPVLTPAVAALAGAVAERYAGTRGDVLRLAVPPRHAGVEKEATPAAPAPEAWALADGVAAWTDHPHAEAYLRHLTEGGSPRAAWGAPPGADWPTLVAHAVAAALAAGRGAVVCAPDVRDVSRLDAALTAVLGAGQHVVLTADLGPAARYRAFLRLRRGAVRVAVGTRAAAYAPVERLGLVVVWDDGDDLHAEPRAPYPHTREVLLLRAELEGAAALVGAFGRSVEADYLVRTGWAHELTATRAAVRSRVRVDIAGATDHDRLRDPYAAVARMPTQVRDAVRAGLEHGPVLVQTPRAGYALALACDRCRTPARCAVCTGPLALGGPTDPPACRWCGTAVPAWACAECGGHGLRAPVLGEARTAEELGRAFPLTRVLTSAGGHVVAEVPDEPAIVVATPGAEPVAAAGYAAVVLLDTALLLARDDLRAAEEALRRWSNAVGLVRPGGTALAVGDAAQPALQALVRWDQAGFARRETAERAAARLPPASRTATLAGDPGALDDALTLLRGTPGLTTDAGLDVLGPVPAGENDERAVLRVPRAHGAALSAGLGELQRVRSARKLEPVRVEVDPLVL